MVRTVPTEQRRSVNQRGLVVAASRLASLSANSDAVQSVPRVGAARPISDRDLSTRRPVNITAWSASTDASGISSSQEQHLGSKTQAQIRKVWIPKILSACQRPTSAEKSASTRLHPLPHWAARSNHVLRICRISPARFARLVFYFAPASTFVCSYNLSLCCYLCFSSTTTTTARQWPPLAPSSTSRTTCAT